MDPPQMNGLPGSQGGREQDVHGTTTPPQESNPCSNSAVGILLTTHENVCMAFEATLPVMV